MRARALLAAAALVIALPANTAGVTYSYVETTNQIADVTFWPLINSGDVAFGDTFEGLPDGIGIVPGPGTNPTYVDLYVNHEQSHVPFGTSSTSVFADGTGPSDPHDSSVTRVRVDLATKAVIDMEVVLPGSAGFIRFCSSTIVGPAEGFGHYTLLTNEESNDVLPVPAGATYGADPSLGANRQAGYSVYLDTKTGAYGPIAGMGRHNHENQVVIPAWKSVVSLSGDDTFTSTSSPAMPNLSQLYMYSAKNATKFLNDQGTLMAFRVTATDAGAVTPTDPQNNANDFFEISPGHVWSGEFIPVPGDVARGTTALTPQDALEVWSNDNNVFQFIRVEDIAYDPDNPRVVYFADTGNSRLLEDAGTGRLWRAPAGTLGTSSSVGRIFKMVMNATDPTKVDEFSVLTDAVTIGMRNPDNIAVGHDSLMVQEDVASNALIWMYSLSSGVWTSVARVDSRPDDDTIADPGESSGIIDVSAWLGAGWWALDVQAHQDVNQDVTGIHTDQLVEPTSTDPLDWHTWSGGPIPPGGAQYRFHREKGQLLFMYVPGS